jgi:hypothetical protein
MQQYCAVKAHGGFVNCHLSHAYLMVIKVLSEAVWCIGRFLVSLDLCSKELKLRFVLDYKVVWVTQIQSNSAIQNRFWLKLEIEACFQSKMNWFWVWYKPDLCYYKVVCVTSSKQFRYQKLILAEAAKLSRKNELIESNTNITFHCYLQLSWAAFMAQPMASTIPSTNLDNVVDMKNLYLEKQTAPTPAKTPSNSSVTPYPSLRSIPPVSTHRRYSLLLSSMPLGT